ELRVDARAVRHRQAGVVALEVEREAGDRGAFPTAVGATRQREGEQRPVADAPALVAGEVRGARPAALLTSDGRAGRRLSEAPVDRLEGARVLVQAQLEGRAPARREIGRAPLEHE